MRTRHTYGLGVMLFAVWLLFFATMAPIVQGKYFPIFDEFQVSSVFHDDRYNHDITGTFRKLVPKTICEFLRINASMLTPSGIVRIDIEFYDQPKGADKTRVEGVQYFGIWKLRTEGYTNARIVYLEVRHGCLKLPFSKSTYMMQTTTSVEIDLDSDPDLDVDM